MPETCYGDRTDGVEEKLRLLRKAQKEGKYELAMSLAESVKDTLICERQLHGGEGEEQVEVGRGGKVENLPAAWAKWARGWAYYKVVGLSESVGLDRQKEPIDLVMGFGGSRVADLRREIRVARADSGSGVLEEVASQVYGEQWQGKERICRIVFLADVPAGGRVEYLIFYGNPDAELPNYTTDLQVNGEGYGLDVANNHYTASLSRQMGQLEKLVYRRGHGHVPYGAQLELVPGGEGHGEPPNIDWGHDYLASGDYQKFRVTAWSQCPNYEVVRGPLCVQVRRWGFPHSAVHPLFTPSRLHMSLTYTFYAGLPYFLKETHMEAVKGFESHVVRDDEWLFWGLPFSDKVWIDRHGELHEGDVADGQHDDLWGVGMFNRENRDAIIVLRLEHGAEKLGAIYHNGEPSLEYFGRGQISCRTPVREPKQFKTGSALWQKNAYILAPYAEEGGAAMVQGVRRRLLQPLAVSADRVPRRVGAKARGALGRFGEVGGAAVGKAAVALKRRVWQALRQVRDDQLMRADGNVADLGYVYDVSVRGDVVHILMTMPHRGRPKYNFIANPIRDRVCKVKGVRDCVVDFTWEPAWTAARLSAAGRREMGLD